MLEAVIFDMDGLLIDSEHLWRAAEIEVFGSVGIALDAVRCAETTGLRVDRVVEHWFARFPWEGPSAGEVEATLVDRVTVLLGERAAVRPGVEHALALMRRRGLVVALASSSTREVIEAVLPAVGLTDAFAAVLSGDDVAEAKPHPAIYLATACRLGVAPERCLVLEDSLVGVIAAKAARMHCIAIPEVFEGHDSRLVVADAVLPSLADLDDSVLDEVA